MAVKVPRIVKGTAHRVALRNIVKERALLRFVAVYFQAEQSKSGWLRWRLSAAVSMGASQSTLIAASLKLQRRRVPAGDAETNDNDVDCDEEARTATRLVKLTSPSGTIGRNKENPVPTFQMRRAKDQDDCLLVEGH